MAETGKNSVGPVTGPKGKGSNGVGIVKTQTMREPTKVFKELLRVGKKVIVSFPNFAHWQCRMQLFFRGKAPVTRQLPFDRHNSPNIHFLSLKDFDRFCKRLGVKVEKKIPLVKTRLSPVRFAPNLFAE